MMMDPSIKFPGVKIEVRLLPGESLNLTIPSNTLRQRILEMMIDPYTFAESNIEGLIVNIGRKRGSIVPGFILGFLPTEDRRMLSLLNPTNGSLTGWISGKRGPSIDQMSDLKTWWSYLFAGFNLLIAVIVTYLKPSPTVNIRAPAKSGIGSTRNSSITEPRCGKLRSLCATCVRSACMRTCLP